MGRYLTKGGDTGCMWLKPFRISLIPSVEKKYAKEPISLAVDSLAILNQKNSTRQIDRNCHLELLILRSRRLAT